jgi:thymidylate kinase
MLSKLDATFQDFNQGGLNWCVLRLPHGDLKSDGDVDLLVDENHLPEIRNILIKQGFVQVPGWSNGIHFLTFEFSTGKWIWLHFVTEISFGPYALLKTQAEGGCLDRKTQKGIVFCLSPDDEFWVLLFHCLVDKGEIPPHHRVNLQELAHEAQSDGPLARVMNEVNPNRWSAEQVLEMACRGEWAKLERISPIFAKNWLREQNIWLWKRSVAFGKSKVNKIRRVFMQRGLGVALLGPDGAGKSTLIGKIQESFIFPVQPVYMGLTGGLLRYVDKLRLPFLVVPGRIFVFWCRYLRALYHQFRGRLVVFDRYVLDYSVPTPYPLNKVQKGMRWIDGHSIPLPDLVLVLDAPGEIMFQRKGEYDPVMLEEWRERFLALQDQISELEILDTTRPSGEVCADAIDRIWKRYMNRWKFQTSNLY